jgi:hypothetical protein
MLWAERACTWTGAGGALAACYARWRAVLGGHPGDAGAGRGRSALVLVGVWLVAGGAGAGGLVRAHGGLLRGGASGGGYQAEAVRAGAGEIEREVGLWRLRLGVERGPGPATWSEAAGSKLDVRGGRVSQGVGAGGCGRARKLRAIAASCWCASGGGAQADAGARESWSGRR